MMRLKGTTQKQQELCGRVSYEDGYLIRLSVNFVLHILLSIIKTSSIPYCTLESAPLNNATTGSPPLTQETQHRSHDGHINL